MVRWCKCVDVLVRVEVMKKLLKVRLACVEAEAGTAREARSLREREGAESLDAYQNRGAGGSTRKE